EKRLALFSSACSSRNRRSRPFDLLPARAGRRGASPELSQTLRLEATRRHFPVAPDVGPPQIPSLSDACGNKSGVAFCIVVHLDRSIRSRGGRRYRVCSFEQREEGGTPYSAPMVIKRNDTNEPEARLRKLIEE